MSRNRLRKCQGFPMAPEPPGSGGRKKRAGLKGPRRNEGRSPVRISAMMRPVIRARRVPLR